MTRRTLDGGMAVLFALCAAAQYNDPAPGNVPWMMVYGAGAVLCGLAASGRTVRPAALVVAAAAGLWAAFLFYGVVAGGQSVFALYVENMEEGGEEAREGWGLAILAGYLTWIGLRRPARAPAAA